MNGETVADIVPGAKDSTGSRILTVYSKIRKTYAVYGTRERVSIQFADDQVLGSEQRRALVNLNPHRGQINGLIDGWRAVGEKGYHAPQRLLFWRAVSKCEIRAKVAMFDRRVADALVMALQADPCHAAALLAEIKTDLLAERTSAARIDYIAIAALVTAAILLVAGIVGSSLFGLAGLTAPARLLWLAGGAGALGALFSTGIAMRSRQILTDLQVRENRADAIVRICIGSVAGVLLVAMLMAKIVTFNFVPGLPAESGASAGGAEPSWLLCALVAFVAGFSERLVSGLLERAGASGAVQNNPLAGSTAAPAAGTALAANENNPLGLARSGDEDKARPAAPADADRTAGKLLAAEGTDSGEAPYDGPAAAANDEVGEAGDAPVADGRDESGSRALKVLA
jgi:hypothetical protein